VESILGDLTKHFYSVNYKLCINIIWFCCCNTEVFYTL